MGKSGIVMSIILGTGIFAFAYSFVSTQNPCAGAKDYASCMAQQTQSGDDQLMTGTLPVAAVVPVTKNTTIKKVLTQTTALATQNQADTETTTQEKAIALAKQQTEAALAAQQLATAQLAQQQAEAALAAQQAAALAAQQTVAPQVATPISHTEHEEYDD